jgi:hypothetical protein
VGNSTWENLLDPFPTAIGAQFATFTANQDVSPQPLPTIYGNELRVGSRLELEARGLYGSTGTPTLVLSFYITPSNLASGIALGATTAMATSTATLWPWVMRYSGLVTQVGGAGTASITGSGECMLGSSLTAFSLPAALPITDALRTVSTVWATNVQQFIGVAATWSASSASNLVRCHTLSAKIVNQGKTA